MQEHISRSDTVLTHAMIEGVNFQEVLELPRLIAGIVLDIVNPWLQRLRTIERDLAGYQRR